MGARRLGGGGREEGKMVWRTRGWREWEEPLEMEKGLRVSRVLETKGF